MLNTGGAIQSLAYNDANSSVQIGVTGTGEMRVFASEKPIACKIDGREVPFDYEECMVVTQVPWSAPSGQSMAEYLF
jgi:raffinose synthase